MLYLNIVFFFNYFLLLPLGERYHCTYTRLFGVSIIPTSKINVAVIGMLKHSPIKHYKLGLTIRNDY